MIISSIAQTVNPDDMFISLLSINGGLINLKFTLKDVYSDNHNSTGNED